MTDPTLSYQVTLKDVATELGNKLDKNTDSIHALELTLARIQPLSDQSADHEARLRVIESGVVRLRYIFGAVGVSAGGISGWLSSLVIHVHH